MIEEFAKQQVNSAKPSASLRELSDAIGVDRTWLSRWLSGQRGLTLASAEKIFAWCGARIETDQVPSK